MNKKLLSAVLVAGLSFAVNAQAGGYVRPQAQWATAKFSVADSATYRSANPNFASVDFDGSVGIGMSAGWITGAEDQHELGLTFTHTENEATFRTPTTEDLYDIKVIPLVANYRYNFRFKDLPFSLVAGPDLGIATAEVTSRFVDQSSGNPFTTRFDTRSGKYQGLVYGGAIGGRWHFAEKFYVEVNYTNLRSTMKPSNETFDRGERKLVQEMIAIGIGGKF
jgi:hypothetical protein